MIQISCYLIPGLAEKYALNCGVPVPPDTKSEDYSREYFTQYYINVLGVVCREFGVNPNDVRTLITRKRDIVLPRQVAMAMIMNKQRGSLADIGEFFKKDHATVSHSVKTIRNLRETDRRFRARTNKFFND